MRLHLPKTLLAAVLAACAALPTWAETQYGWITAASVENSGPAKSVDGGDMTKITYTAVSDTPSGSITVTTDGATYTLGANNLSSFDATDKDVKFTGATDGNQFLRGTTQSTANSVWLTGGRFENGTDKLENLNGITNVYITGAQIYAQSNSDKTLTSNYFLGAGTNNGTLRLDGNGTVTFSGQTTLVANATIHKEGGSKGNAQDIFNHLNLNGCTLTANAGKDLVIKDVTGSGALALTGGDANDASTIQIAGSNNIGTLTLNGASSTGFTLVGTSADATTITSLVTSGSVLDASGMEGTLTISGAKWTGGLAAASVEVLKAKDTDTATTLAAAMDSTHGLSYRFSADGSSVYRTLRTEYYRNLTATTNANDSLRIVIGSIEYDGKTFTNVALKDLLAGDKVTLGTAADEEAGTAAQDLTGWIGYNNDVILADLEFAAGTTTHVNNGNAGGTITYSGAITGTGTLSFDWSGKTNTYVFTGDLSDFTGMIKDEATLNVTIGGTLAEGVSNAVKATIDIAGILTVNRETTFTEGFTAKQLNGNQKIIFDGNQTINCTQDGNFSKNIDVKTGKLTVLGSVKTSAQLDLSGPNDSRYNGTVEVATSGRLTIGSSIWGLAETSKILLQEGGMLKWNGLEITGKTAVENVETGLKFGATDALQLNNANHTVTNSIITYSRDDEKTLSWQLVDTDLNVESGTVNLAGNSIGGNLTINAGTVKTSANSDKGVVGAHTVTINAGGTLEASGIDAFGWKAGQKCTQIVMGGTAADSLAQLKLTSGSLWQTTLGSDVLLKGYSSIGGTSAFKTAGGKIEATGTNNVISSSMCVMDDIEVKVTGSTDTLQINNIQYFHNYDTGEDSSGTVSVTGEGTLNVGAVTRSALKNTGSGSVEITGAVESSTISNTGSGSVTLSGTTDSATKLISSGSNGSLTAQGVSSLAEVKAENGGSVTLRMAAADDLTAVSLTDLVIGNGSSVSVQASDGTDGGTANVDNITVGQGTALGANLTLGEGAGMSFNVAGLTGADGEAAICTLTGSLTLGLNVELHLLNLGMLKEGKSITLFTGVTGFTYSGATSVATLSDDDISTGVDASRIFGNVDSGFFTVKYVGNNVILTASTNVPEPTTSTLSLLALMGLAARRRRRKA
ncbi:MAG: beta strand repeat-containing protein [Akkermansia sp.]